MATLDVFKISTINNNNNLYANSNQQCSVLVEILKVDWNGNANVKSLLTASEKETLVIRPYSAELCPDQAPGWDCEFVKNVYEEGPWRRSLSAQQEAAPPDPAAETALAAAAASPDNMVPERIDRYMKTDRAQSQRFMACITVDGKQYSTNYSQGLTNFNSYVDLLGIAPYTLRVNDLVSPYRDDAYSNKQDKNNHIDVDVYYWYLPGGLKVIGENFRDWGHGTPLMDWAYGFKKDGWVRMGLALRTATQRVTLYDIDSRVQSKFKNDVVPFLTGDNSYRMRAMRYANEGSPNPSNYNNRLHWTITDNYGCRSAFYLKEENNGNTLKLEDAPL